MFIVVGVVACLVFWHNFSFTVELSYRNMNDMFSLSSLSSDCDFDIILNQQAYLLFETKNILFCCVTNRFHGVVMTNHWQHTLLSNCHIDVTNVMLQGKVCASPRPLAADGGRGG